jgi:protein-L-isoaspartate(D-aspartate) O-methyltransferase
MPSLLVTIRNDAAAWRPGLSNKIRELPAQKRPWSASLKPGHRLQGRLSTRQCAPRWPPCLFHNVAAKTLLQSDGSTTGLQEVVMTDFVAARRAMVDGQVRTSDVTNLALITAMLDIPREAFVPAAQAPVAYLDRDVSIAGVAAGPARYLMKPMVLARLIQAANPARRDRVLVIGAGTGYAAAVIARLAAEVVALEEDEALCQQARTALASAGSHNVNVIHGRLADGAPDLGPYDVILIDGGVETVPDRLGSQLSTRGRLVAVEVSGPSGKAKLFQAVNGRLLGREMFDALAPVLPGFVAQPAFVF